MLEGLQNSRLLFTTCLIQMVMGSRGQLIKETYVYVEAAKLVDVRAYVVGHDDSCHEVSQPMWFKEQYPGGDSAGTRARTRWERTPSVHGTPDAEADEEVEREHEDEKQDDEEEMKTKVCAKKRNYRNQKCRRRVSNLALYGKRVVVGVQPVRKNSLLFFNFLSFLFFKLSSFAFLL